MVYESKRRVWQIVPTVFSEFNYLDARATRKYDLSNSVSFDRSMGGNSEKYEIKFLSRDA